MSYIITIGRQFGCGAHEIGTKLAEKLGVPYYDKELMKRASKDSGFDENLFKFYDEKPTRSFLFNVSTDGLVPMNNNGISLEDRIMQYQFDTIKNVAREGSCIIVGRCAEYVLRDYDNMLSVFLHADDEYRLNRVTEKYGYNRKDAQKEIKATDKKRARFHDFYSEAPWGKASTYDLCVNVSKLGVDATVDLIADCVKRNFK